MWSTSLSSNTGKYFRGKTAACQLEACRVCVEGVWGGADTFIYSSYRKRVVVMWDVDVSRSSFYCVWVCCWWSPSSCDWRKWHRPQTLCSQSTRLSGCSLRRTGGETLPPQSVWRESTKTCRQTDRLLAFSKALQMTVVYVRDNACMASCALNDFNARCGGQEPPDTKRSHALSRLYLGHLPAFTS